jgi:hypothetical protein
MANWYGTSRSNYFRVKDADKFKDDIDSLSGEIRIAEYEKDGDTYFGLFPEGEYGGFPCSIQVEHEDGTYDNEHVDIADVVYPHLIDNEVAIFMEVGAEKTRYVTGFAQAVDHKGEQKVINLWDIYNFFEDEKKKGELRPGVTRVEF